MSIQSMTGFGRGESQNDIFTFTVDIKSVNHRFKDTRFKMSSIFAPLEIELKKKLQAKFKRGSFDIFINFKKAASTSNSIQIDTEKVGAFLDQMSAISEKKDVEMEFSPTDFLRQEFYQERDEKTEEQMFSLAKESFDSAVLKLEESRILEGQKLTEVLKKHKLLYLGHFENICKKLPEFQKSIEEKLKKRFTESQAELGIDEPRFMQEVIYYLEKMDVSEEVNRIKIHLEKLDSLLGNSEEVGRQIDFLMQELGRETNTIGSKSSISEISVVPFDSK